jgi:phage terminase small subunit
MCRDSETAPEHLREATRIWWLTVCESYQLEQHHVRLLTLAGESWDRGEQAREALAEHGLTYEDRFGQPRSRPEVAIERDSRIAFARLLRELALDVEVPTEDVRPPVMRGMANMKRST